MTTHQIQDNSHVRKMLADIARAPSEECLWCAPATRGGRLAGDVLWDTAPGEMPYLEGAGGPQHGVHPTANGIEAVAVAACVRGRGHVIATVCDAAVCELLSACPGALGGEAAA